MKKTQIVVLVTVILLIVISICYGFSRNLKGPIKDNEFSIKTLETSDKGCIAPSTLLLVRCMIAGGILQTPVTNIGLGIVSSFGCYPNGATKDSGKICKSNNDCEGECIWLSGDVITSDSSATCSSYKKPLFMSSVSANTNFEYSAVLCKDVKEKNCADKADLTDREECYKWAADRSGDKNYCYKISSALQKNECFENLAGKLKDTELCKEATSPVGYCMYLNIVKNNDVSQCATIQRSQWVTQCYRDMAEKSGKGSVICNGLNSAEIEGCRSSIEKGYY